ncbi:MAG TPA: winged helix DNA-binding domain-containing protein [Chloroflexia bacterium]
MTEEDLRQQRLHNLGLSTAPYATPEAVVAALGAVQAQDYPAAAWALGLRMGAATAATIDAALAAGAILRTHVLRPTWHFVAPADIRWMLALTGPRVQAAIAGPSRRLGLDAAMIAAANTALADALQGSHALTRAELTAVLARAGIAATEPLRNAHLLMHAELEGLICSGPRQGKQMTYALLDERVPPTRPLTRDEALAALTRRYFTSHGPATIPDFVWWSGLTGADARAGLALVGDALTSEEIDGRTYWFAPGAPPTPMPTPTAHLLPNYDEYIVAYTDRRAVHDAAAHDLDARGNILFSHTIVLDGRVVGTWKRTLRRAAVVLETTLLAPLAPAATAAVAAATARYGAFLGLAVEPA